MVYRHGSTVFYDKAQHVCMFRLKFSFEARPESHRHAFVVPNHVLNVSLLPIMLRCNELG